MQFNPGSSAGIVDDIDSMVDTNSTTYPIAEKTRNINRWYDRAASILMQADGRWQWDDTNWTDYPIATTNLVDSQQDYSIIQAIPTAGQDYLRILRVEVLNNAGNWNLIAPIDQADIYDQSVTDFLKTSGMPAYYDKQSTSIFLYPKPLTANVTLTNGLRIWFQRAPSYFVTTDTTKQPGFPSIFHRYLSLGAAYDYAKKKTLPQVNQLRADILEIEDQMSTFMALRNRDEKIVLTPKFKNYR